MGNSVIHFVRAQSQQRFNTPPLGAVRASKASSPQYRLARPRGIFIPNGPEGAVWVIDFTIFRFKNFVPYKRLISYRVQSSFGGIIFDMDEETQKRLNSQEAKLDAIFKSVEKTRKYFLWIIWITVLAVVIPLIGLAFVVPKFLSSFMGAYQGLI